MTKKKTKFVDALGQVVHPEYDEKPGNAFWCGVRYRFPCAEREEWAPWSKRASKTGELCHKCYSKTLSACCELAFEVDA